MKKGENGMRKGESQELKRNEMRDNKGKREGKIAIQLGYNQGTKGELLGKKVVFWDLINP